MSIRLTGFAQAWKVLEYKRLSWKVLKIKYALKSSRKTLKVQKSPWILPFTGGFNTVFGDLKQYKILVPLFGAAYSAPNKGTTIFQVMFRNISQPSPVQFSPYHFSCAMPEADFFWQCWKKVSKDYIASSNWVFKWKKKRKYFFWRSPCLMFSICTLTEILHRWFFQHLLFQEYH